MDLEQLNFRYRDLFFSERAKSTIHFVEATVTDEDPAAVKLMITYRDQSTLEHILRFPGFVTKIAFLQNGALLKHFTPGIVVQYLQVTNGNPERVTDVWRFNKEHSRWETKRRFCVPVSSAHAMA